MITAAEIQAQGYTAEHARAAAEWMNEPHANGKTASNARANHGALKSMPSASANGHANGTATQAPAATDTAKPARGRRKASKPAARTGRRNTAKHPRNRRESKAPEIRAWALAHNYPCSPNGRIPVATIAAWEARTD